MGRFLARTIATDTMSRAALYSSHNLSPAQLRVKKENEAGTHGKAPRVCVVTGGTGLVGQRLVEMLVERGAERVVSFDIVPSSEGAWQHPAIEYVVGDITDAAAVSRAIKGADCVWHIAAAVGPYHPAALYERVNVGGTANVIAACREHNVPKLVYSCSPSTRFFADGSDMDGLRESEMPAIPQAKYLAEYAKTKAEGELLMREAVARDDGLLALACAPHQVYGPRDNLFLPNFLEAAGSGKLRIFGRGENRICFTHVDNYCHGLIKSEQALFKGSPALGKFYVVTDGNTHPFEDGYALFWNEIDRLCVGMGFASIKAKMHLPRLLMLFVGLLCDCIGLVLGKVLRLNSFAVRMVVIHRWFRIDAAQEELGYQPVIPFSEGWLDTIGWFKEFWLPIFDSSSGLVFAAKQTQRKIDTQAKGKKL